MAELAAGVSSSVIGGTHPSVMEMVEEGCRRTQEASQAAPVPEGEQPPQEPRPEFLD